MPTIHITFKKTNNNKIIVTKFDSFQVKLDDGFIFYDVDKESTYNSKDFESFSIKGNGVELKNIVSLDNGNYNFAVMYKNRTLMNEFNNEDIMATNLSHYIFDCFGD